MMAVAHGHDTVVSYLLTKGADPKIEANVRFLTLPTLSYHMINNIVFKLLLI